VNSTAAAPKILVADDNRDAADAIVWLLRREGLDALAAYDGEQATESANILKPQLAILDLDMPGLDGFMVAKALRRGQAPGDRLILIALSGRTTPDDVRAAIEAGFDRHVGKPIPGDELCALVSAYLAESAPGRFHATRRDGLTSPNPRSDPGPRARQRSKPANR
jgi:two-component system CheB/CheR fusion protein